ncbi:MAG: hypothetical protein KatS3mg015_2214 [Fimbriimonadales bacterium]|nr:MAG: hypothetical protein KatS3mg015_2214 [Fimbriimonadales bacterium]
MSRRLRAIGFGEVWDEDAAKTALHRLADAAMPRGDQWVTTIAPGIDAILHVNEDLGPTGLVVRLHGQRQPLLVEELETRILDGFTSLDGCPITPIRARVQGEVPEIERRSLWAVEYAGFCDSVETIGDRPYGVEEENGETRFSGVLLRTVEAVNPLTERRFALSSLWVPGAVIPFCSDQQTLPPPGSEVSLTMDLFVEVFQRL